MNRILLLFIPLVYGCARADHSEVERAPRPVKSVVASTSEYLERDFAGYSTPLEAVNMAFKVAGQLSAIPVFKGELVASGAILAQIDPRDVELQLAADKSSYEQAKSQYERAQRLVSREAISMQELERAESDFSRARSTYQNSEELLDQTTLRAPFEAVVERVYVDTYQRVQAGEVVVRIVAPTTTNVEFTLPESALGAIKNSATSFRVRFDLLPDLSFAAKLTEYARTSSDAAGFPVTLRVENPDPDQYLISSGMSCMITMSTPERDLGAVVLPMSAIYSPVSGGTYVWVVDDLGRVELRAVDVERATGQHSVVLSSGVEAGDRVVTAGVYQLQDNQRVKILE